MSKLGLGKFDRSNARTLRRLDVFSLSSDRRNLQIYLWSHSKSTVIPIRLFADVLVSMIEQSKYRPSYNVSTSEPIASVVPLDFNLDGHLDVLVWTQDQVEDGGWWGTKRTILNGEIYLGGGENGGFSESELHRSSTE